MRVPFPLLLDGVQQKNVQNSYVEYELMYILVHTQNTLYVHNYKYKYIYIPYMSEDVSVHKLYFAWKTILLGNVK